MEPPDALDTGGVPSAAPTDPLEVEALRRQVESLQQANAHLEQQLVHHHHPHHQDDGDDDGADDLLGRPSDLFSEESREVVVSDGSSDVADSDDGGGEEGGSRGGGGGARSGPTGGGDRGAGDADADALMEASAGVPVRVRRESRTVSAEMFPTQAKSIAKTIKPRASFRLLVEVRTDQYVWWEFATAHRDVAFGVQFHYPSPQVKYNTADALLEGILTQVEVFQDHCTARRVTVTKPGLLRYLNAIFGAEPTTAHRDEIFAYVAELQRGVPIAETYPRTGGGGINNSGGGVRRGKSRADACDAEARAMLSDRSSKLVMVPLARQSSHHMVQYGFVQAPSDGQISLTWDNSYSRVRSKDLTLHYEVAEGGGGGQPPSRWAAGPVTVAGGPMGAGGGGGSGRGRGNLITSGNKAPSSNVFLKNLNMVKTFLEQRRRKDSEEETLFFTRPPAAKDSHVIAPTTTAAGTGLGSGSGAGTATDAADPAGRPPLAPPASGAGHHLDIGGGVGTGPATPGRSQPSLSSSAAAGSMSVSATAAGAERTPDPALLQRVTSSGHLPQMEQSPTPERAAEEGGVAVLEETGLLSRSRNRGNTEVGFV